MLHGLTRGLLAAQAAARKPLALMYIGRHRSKFHYQYIEDLRGPNGMMPAKPVGAVITDNRMTREILRDHRFIAYTPPNFPYPAPLRWALRWTDPGLPNPIEAPAMLALDPPEHARFRKLVSGAFTARAIGTLEERIHSVTNELLDDLEHVDEADLITAYANRIPIAIIAEILGLARSDAPLLLELGNRIVALLDIGQSWKAYRDAISALEEIDQYFDAHLHMLKRAIAEGSATEGILTSLVRDGDLSDRELKATMSLLLGAGFETTVNLIGNGIVALLQNPRQLAYLREKPDSWPNAIEEVLRYDAPVQVTGRIAGESIVVQGHSFVPGDLIVLLLGGANRDPAVFERPHEFDVARGNAREHLAFSSGAHACLGASLARMEGLIAIRSLFERYPNICLTADPTPDKYVNLRGVDSLPVTLGHR
ncbi:cytochrome P450 [Mycobacteroides abscessus]|uniref:cytochrome P450 n=1 Tax=Mycobacteroides abscessus TaxID=36809 RepID=UPI000C25EC36|nr:cytochrome P450 [Mycobacteroides abscessus]